MFKSRKSIRLKGFDYSSDNHYYVTTNVKNRISCLGNILGGKMYLNALGEIVESQWLWLQGHYNYIRLHEYVVMPDHFHGIIEINRSLIDFPDYEVCQRNLPNDQDASEVTGRDLSLQKHLDHNENFEIPIKPQTKIKPLSELMGAFKMSASKKIHELGIDFDWQRSFNDEIIKDAEAFANISQYIKDNPKKFKK